MIVLFKGSIAYSQIDLDYDGKPMPAQIFPNNPEKTSEETERNIRESKEYENSSKEQDEDPE